MQRNFSSETKRLSISATDRKLEDIRRQQQHNYDGRPRGREQQQRRQWRRERERRDVSGWQTSRHLFAVWPLRSSLDVQSAVQRENNLFQLYPRSLHVVQKSGDVYRTKCLLGKNCLLLVSWTSPKACLGEFLQSKTLFKLSFYFFHYWMFCPSNINLTFFHLILHLENGLDFSSFSHSLVNINYASLEICCLEMSKEFSSYSLSDSKNIHII